MNHLVSIIALAGGIALLDIVLSGDNALVIGAAASRLHGTQRRFAIIVGGLGAIVLRLALATVATELLRITYLQFVGGLILLVIAVRLLMPEGAHRKMREGSDHLLSAVLTILLADVSMSLDNVISVGALARGNVMLLVLGLAFSMALLFVASSIIAVIVARLSWLIDIASVVLAWTAASLVLEDPFVRAMVQVSPERQVVIHLGAVAAILVIDLGLRLRNAIVRRRVTTRGEAVARAEGDTRPREAVARAAVASAPLGQSQDETSLEN